MISVPNSRSQNPEELEVSKDGILGNLRKHLKFHLEADQKYQQNAERIQMKYCKSKHRKVKNFKLDDFVSIKIPRIDRASTDIHRLLCEVIERLGLMHHLYC